MSAVSNDLLSDFSKKAGYKGFIAVENPKASRIAEFHKNGEYALSIMPDGEIRYKPDTPYHADMISLVDIFLELKEAYGIYENAKSIPIQSVSNFRLLSEYGNYLLAARKEQSRSCLHYVTWQYDYNRDGVSLGHYFGDSYTEAKRDFAIRADLINKKELFTEEELFVLHGACSFRGQNDSEISFDDERRLQSVMEKIEQNIPTSIFDNCVQENETSLER